MNEKAPSKNDTVPALPFYRWTEKRWNNRLQEYETTLQKKIPLALAQMVEDYYNKPMPQPEKHHLYILSDGQRSRSFYSIHSDLLAFISAQQPQTNP